MIQAELDTTQLQQLLRQLETAPERLQEAKRMAFETAAPRLKAEVDKAIGGTGKVQRWQSAYVGSKGGYAAVRPKAKTYAEDANGRKTRYSVGQVTNAINSGHRFRSPSGRDPRYKPRVKSGRQSVQGKYFYEAAAARVPQIAQEAAEQVAQALVEHLEG